MRKRLINFLKTIHIDDPVRWLYTRSISAFWHIYSFITNRNRRFFKNYQKMHAVHKLHLGCGLNYLDGWLNTDIKPHQNRIYLDITKKFTFPDNSFDYVFSEHVIEHIPYRDGENMLREAYRVLKPGGTLRLVTPDFKFLLGLYENPQLSLHKEYIAWNSELFIKDKAPHTALSVINNYVRDWGHIYIYDVETFRTALADYGFVDIAQPEIGTSSHKELQNLEHESRHPEGFLALESMILEARKPAA